MALTRKPTVFFSHSSKNRRELIRLKQLLEEKTIGAIEFFLASDEESIRLGTLWPQEVRAALDRAKLMFVFVSTDSLQSGWAYFEAGYGYCRLDRVIPLCLPGLDKGRVPPPFGLLQTRNLHSAADLNILLRTCNEVFGTKVQENFSRAEFESIFSTRRLNLEPSVNWIDAVEKLIIKVYARRGSAEKFAKLCVKKGFDCDESGLNEVWQPKVVASGVTLTFQGVDIADMADFIDTPVAQTQRSAEPPTPIWHEFELAPELLEETFPLLDQWKTSTRMTGPYRVRVTFADRVKKEAKPHQLSQRIYRSQISLRPDGSFRFGNIDFTLELGPPLSYPRAWILKVDWPQPLAQLPLADLIMALFTLGVLIGTSTPKRTKR